MTANELDAQITELRNQVATAERELTAARNNLAAWESSLQQAEANGADFNELQANRTKIAENRTRVDNAQRVYDAAKAELERKLEYREAIEAAAIDAVKRGVSPEQAYALAEAEVLAQQRKTKLLNGALFVGGAILIIVVLVWAWKKYRS